MINKIVYEMKGNAEKKHGNYYSSLLHGAISEMMDSQYADEMHQSGLHPYSQYAYVRDNRMFWEINALTQKAKEQIVDVIKERGSVYVRHKEEMFELTEIRNTETSYEELINNYYFGDNPRFIEIEFVTPTSFKKDNEYVIYPNLRLIFQSLMKKFDSCTEGTKISDEQFLEDIVKHTKIVNYRLKSTYFSMEKVKIQSFVGNITIRVNGPSQMVNTVWLLMAFGEFSGVGIKTGLGMGGYNIIRR